MAYQVLARKWRPKSFAALIGQEHVCRALTNAIRQGQLHHAYLFTGTRGVGKTTIARVLAKSLNCETGITIEPCGQCRTCLDIDVGRFVDLIEVDAASRTRVEDTRELLENVQYAPTQGRFKIYLIDEVHMLSGHSFNALLKTLEEPPPHVKFILATTDPDKIPITVLSRCLRFSLRALSSANITTALQTILKAENISFEPGCCELVASLASGSMRDALSLLEQAIAYGNNVLKLKELQNLLGLSYQALFPSLLEALLSLEVARCLQIVAQMADEGADFEKLLQSILQALHAIAIAQQVGEGEDLAAFADLPKDLLSLKEKLAPEEVQLLYQIGLNGRRDLAFAPDRRCGFEMILLRMMVFRPAFEETSCDQQASSLLKITPNLEKSSNLPTVKEVKETTKEEQQAASLPPQAPMDNEEAVISDLNWNEIVTKLSLSGFCRALVRHCVVTKWDRQQLTLTLEESQKACLNNQRQLQIQEAVSQYFKQPIKVNIIVGPINQTTPAQHSEKLAIERVAVAELAITEDPLVNNILDAFDGTVEKIDTV